MTYSTQQAIENALNAFTRLLTALTHYLETTYVLTSSPKAQSQGVDGVCPAGFTAQGLPKGQIHGITGG